MWASLGSSCLGLCDSWTCVSFIFFRLVKFSVIISSNRFSIPFSLSSPSSTTMDVVICLMLSQRFLKLSLVFKFSFLFAAQIGCFLLPCFPNHWISHSLYRICSWFLQVYFSIPCVIHLGLFLWFSGFFMLIISLFRFSPTSSFLLLCFLSILFIIVSCYFFLWLQFLSVKVHALVNYFSKGLDQ